MSKPVVLFACVHNSGRSVAARAALGAEHSRIRRQFMRDGDLRVRRAAVHAALARPVPEDSTDLAEAARLDPDPLVRSLAVQALGTLGKAPAV